MRAGFDLFKNFEQDAKDFAGFSATKLDMPFLVLTGEKASGTVLIDQTKLVANNVKGIIVKGSGHWLMEETPNQVIPEVVSFINDVPDTASIRRLTPDDINALKATALGARDRMALRFVDPYNDFLSFGGKLWLDSARLTVSISMQFEAGGEPDYGPDGRSPVIRTPIARRWRSPRCWPA